MNNNFRFLIVLACGALVAAATTDAQAEWRGWDREYSSLVVFGDSLSDPGNTYAVTHEVNDGVWEVIPDVPYDSKRFSNGITWVEHLAAGLRLYRGGMPAYRKPWFGNYAYAGARAQGVGAEKPSLGDQVQKYFGRTGGTADPGALYVIQIGGNDIRDALTAAQIVLLGGGSAEEAQTAAGQILAQGVNAIAYNMTLLRQAGAQNFLVATVPDLGKTPAVTALGASADATALSAGFNLGLDGVISLFAADGATLFRLDLFSFVNTATAMPLGLGFVNASEPCLQVFTPEATGVCEDADQYLFWDGLHPTRAGHRLVGNIAINVMSLD